MKFDGQVGCMTRMNGLNFGEDPDADLAYQWDTKHKVFSQAEVRATLSAVLVSPSPMQRKRGLCNRLSVCLCPGHDI